MLEHAPLHAELSALLPGAAAVFGYEQADVDEIHAAVARDRPGALNELISIVRQWRIDIVAAGADSLLAEGAGRRARIQFRMDVMGKSTDENGEAYAAGVLDWAPEPKVWVIDLPSDQARSAR
jgi:hypothetical protein